MSRQIPVGLDPAVSGLADQIGEVVAAADGSASWVKVGPGATDWRKVSADPDVALVTDGSLAGGGTDDSPLKVQSADWFDQLKAIFFAKTGLQPQEAVASKREDFDYYSGEYINDVAASGAGSSIAPATAGSIAVLKSPNTNTAGQAEWYPGAAAGLLIDQLASLTMKRWMVAFRFSLTNAGFTGTDVVLGLRLAAGAHRVGIGAIGTGVGPATLQYVKDSTNVFNTGKAWPFGDGFSGFVSCYIANFNLKDLVVNMGPGSATDQVAAQMSSLTDIEGTCRPYAVVKTSGTNLSLNTVNLDKAFCVAEL